MVDPSSNSTTTDSDSLPIPPLDPSIFSDSFLAGGGDIDDLDFTFDDLYLPSDTPHFLNSLPPPHFSSDWIPDFPIPSDHTSIPSRVFNSDDLISDFLNVSSPESSHESANKASIVARVLDPEVSSSQGSGNSGSVVSEPLNYPSPDSANNSIHDFVDQKIELKEEGTNCLLKRKKESEEDVNSEFRTSKYQRSNSGENPNQSYGYTSNTGISEDDEKKKARLMRNRESAQLSRQRKKHYVEELEDKLRTMHSTVQDLNSKISYIMAENASLRQQLSGGAMCPPPVPPPGMYPHPPMAPMGYPWMPCPPYVVKPQGSQVPLVPIPRLKSQNPSPAPKAKKVESKKTKTKKVASVSFLGLLFFILFFGGLVPMVNVNFGGIRRDTVLGGSNYFGNGFYYQHHGRLVTVNGHLNGSDQKVGMGLSNGFTNTTIHCGRDRAESNVEQIEGSQAKPGSDEFVRPDNSSMPLVASLYVPRNDKLVKIEPFNTKPPRLMRLCIRVVKYIIKYLLCQDATRNKMVFSQDATIRAIQHQATKTYEAFQSDKVTGQPLNHITNWVSPFAGKIKLNTDGCSKGNPGPAGYGGLFRGERGTWLHGYHGKLEEATSMEAELWAVYRGLTIMLEKGMKDICIETDSEQVVQLIQGLPSQHFQQRALLEDAKFLMQRCNCTIAHIHKEGNKSADGLANMGVKHHVSFVFLNDPPDAIANLLVADIIGASFSSSSFSSSSTNV